MNAPVATIRTKEGGWVTSAAGVIGVSVKPSNPNAAIVFLNWLLSQEGQSIFSRSVITPSSRTDVSLQGIPPALLVPPDEKPYWHDEKALSLRRKIMKDTGKIVSSASSK